MFLSVKEMELRRIRFDETYAPGQLDFTSESLTQEAPLHVAGSAELLPHTGGEIRIRGQYQVEISAACDRCLARARFPLDSAFDLFYRPMSVIARDEEIEIDDAEAEIGFYEHGGLELKDVVREQVLLALPMQLVCSEACLGICPACGRNRNESPCQCSSGAEGDARWSALRDLRR